jgi:type II secretory pathway component PulK
MMHRSRPSSTERSSPRRGAAALFVLLCLSIATIVATLLVKAAVVEKTYASRLALTHQADWLVEAGLNRAAAQLGRSRSYAGETWPLPAAQLDGSREATIHIDVKTDADSKLRRVHVAVELQGSSGTTVRATKEIRIAA